MDMGIREFVQVSYIRHWVECQHVESVSSCWGMQPGWPAGVPREGGLSLTPSTLHSVQELLAAWGPAATLDP